MKTTIKAVLVLLAVILVACGNTITGSGNVRSEARDVSDFAAVTVGGSGEVLITQGDEESLTIEAEDNLLPLIKSEIRDGTLVLGLEGPRGRNIRATKPIRYLLTVRDLTAISASGSVAVQADELEAERLALSLNGSSTIKVAELESEELTVQLNGSSDAELAGEADQQQVVLSGSGHYRAAELESETASVVLNGSSEAILWVEESLDTVINGGSQVQYYGNPVLKQQLAGSGQVKGLGDK
jgi:predicted small secreted protein